ncbi:hypothetical protein PFTANZ_03623 [Plasmodium falciparum Tanzania (2000708)]|uniref:Uncharacterized protein n=1 Tax=Plasmodium falciparum Tanzania (2000708) TaxID=1036725 RepID=A0A024W563_PLAFA|nr:hypothetical protein PFTANZ_03623 [Plasmodium falciparum Tanzania (2000708)]
MSIKRFLEYAFYMSYINVSFIGIIICYYKIQKMKKTNCEYTPLVECIYINLFILNVVKLYYLFSENMMNQLYF